VDNGCTVFIDAAGHRFRRKEFDGKLDVAMCGVKGDGSTDDTKALQSSIAAICHGHGEGGAIAIPAQFNILITASLSFRGCTGLRFRGEGMTGGDVSSSATIIWGGPPGDHAVIAVDQAAAISLENLTIYTFDKRYARAPSAPGADIGIDDTETGLSVVQTNTDNHFSNVIVNGPPQADPNFVGIRIGFGDLKGNVDIATFDRISIGCSGTTPTSATSNGSGIKFVQSNAEPYATRIIQTQLLNCSAGFDLHGMISNLVLDGGAGENNYTDLRVATGARGLVFRNFRSEGATRSVVGQGGDDITIDHVTFSAVRETGIDIQSEGQTIIDTVEFEGPAGARPLVPNRGGSAVTTIRNSIFPTGDCPTPQSWAVVLSHANTQKVGPACPNFDAVGAQGHYALVEGGGELVLSSPKWSLCGRYRGSGFADDCWNEQDVLAEGVNGASTLELTHSGSTGPSSVRLPALALPHYLMGAVSPTIASGFSRGPSLITANGTAAFTITVGTEPENTGVVNLPAADHGWICQAQDITTHSAQVSQTIQTGSGKTNCTLTQFNAAMAPSNWKVSDILAVHAFAY